MKSQVILMNKLFASAVTIMVLASCTPDTREVVYVQISSTVNGDTLADTVKVRVFPAEKQVVLNSISLIDTVGGVAPDRELKSLPDKGGMLFIGGTWSSSCDVYSPQIWICQFTGTSLRMPQYSEEWFTSGDTLINRYSSTANLVGNLRSFGDTVRYVRRRWGPLSH